jgi:hypothetical protein
MEATPDGCFTMKRSDGSDPALEAVKESLQRGNKIEAIKRYRELTGKDLKSAKEDIDRAQGALRAKAGDSGPAAGKTGCGGSSAVLLFVLAVAAAAYAGISARG